MPWARVAECPEQGKAPGIMPSVQCCSGSFAFPVSPHICRLQAWSICGAVSVRVMFTSTKAFSVPVLDSNIFCSLSSIKMISVSSINVSKPLTSLALFIPFRILLDVLLLYLFNVFPAELGRMRTSIHDVLGLPSWTRMKIFFKKIMITMPIAHSGEGVVKLGNFK